MIRTNNKFQNFLHYPLEEYKSEPVSNRAISKPAQKLYFNPKVTMLVS
jgi:hypothetical protein